MSASGWDSARRQARKAEEDRPTIFVKLQTPGETAIVVFVGELVKREVVYLGGKYQDYDPSAHREESPQFRWKSNVFTVARSPTGEGDWTRIDRMQILEMSNKLFVDLGEHVDRFPLDRWMYRIKRKSQNEYIAGVEKEIPAELHDQIDRAKLHDIQGGAGGGQRPDHGGGEDPDSDMPF